MYTPLLLDEGSAITFTALLVKSLAGTVLYGLSLYYLFTKPRTSRSKGLGLGMACLLACIGFSLWPKPDVYGATSTGEYFIVFLLFIPLVLAGFVFLLSRRAS